ncbi:Neogenin-like protein [Sarcoptes scabiei]|uniref:Neogenin-like protein n=1 Tax=Sarcoptes scabiei TaxID=52283 RepID=A0A132A948_SARSC|nr:Neogenin-like protein [Sarcoptes scabiei]
MDFDFFDKPFLNKPHNVTLRALSTDTISIHWKPPYEPVSGFKLRFRSKGNKKQETINLSPSIHHHELKNLERSTVYNIKLAAIFNNETGPFTEWFVAETLAKDLDETQVPDKPSSLRAKVEGNTIIVTWAPPKNRNIMVRGYTIGWGEGIPDRYTQVIEGDQQSFVIPNVSVSSEYVITLRANNLRGEGQPVYDSVKVTMDTSLDQNIVMLPPIGLKATALSSETIALEWSDSNPDPSQSPPSHHLQFLNDNRWYLVRFTNSFHSNSPRYRYLNTTKLNCLIEDLKPNTQYEFSVKVIKNKRNSTWSMTALNSTLEAVPSTPPRDLTVVASDNDDPTTINLHWQPPKQPNGQITGYIIFYTTDNTLEDRDWIVKVIVGAKLNAILNGLQPSSIYYFKIQARNSKGYGPLSSEITFRTLPANISISLFVLIVLIAGVFGFIAFIVLLTIFLKQKSNSKNLKNRKGYLATATNHQHGKNTNSRLNNTRELKPPDLWIHHNDQVEMKLMEKSNDNESACGVGRANNNNTNNSSTENSFAKIKKTNSTYGVNASLYDDINKSPSSPIMDNMGMATMRRSTSIRPKAPGCIDHSIMNGMINLEPSTALSRPLYPKTQFNMAHIDSLDSTDLAFNQTTNLHLYDPVSGSTAHIAIGNIHQESMGNLHNGGGSSGINSFNNSSYMSSGNSSSPHSVISNNTVLTNSSTNTNITNSSTSPPNTSIYLSNNRPKANHSALKSFGVPTPPPPLPSLVTLATIQNSAHANSIYNSALTALTSPSKKFLLTTTNNLNNSSCGGSSSTLASNCKSVTNFSDDNSISASFNADDLHQEMANLDNLMKDLNAMKPNHVNK